jgi:hypothetical protein
MTWTMTWTAGPAASGRVSAPVMRPARNGAYPVRPAGHRENVGLAKIIRAHPAAAGSPCCLSGQPEV